MNIVQIENPETRAKCQALSFKSILKASIEAQEVYIRRQFDCASTDATALAAIEVAQVLGFVEIARSMSEEYDSQIGRAQA